MPAPISTRSRALRCGFVNEHVLASLMTEVIELVRHAAESILVPNFGKVAAQQKIEFGLLEPVTEIDRKISAYILEAVRKSLPGSYSEEDLPANAADRRRENLLWQFDPLDGTQEYIDGYFRGVAIQGALLARTNDVYLPLSGFIYRAATQTLWYLDEQGELCCEINGKPHRPPELRRDDTLKGCVRKVVPDMALNDFYETLARQLGENCEVVDSGGAGALFIDLLDGSADVVIANQDRSKAWDIAMAIPLVEARGGFICDFAGRPFEDLNAVELRNMNGFISSIVYSKEELLPLLPAELLKRS